MVPETSSTFTKYTLLSTDTTTLTLSNSFNIFSTSPPTLLWKNTTRKDHTSNNIETSFFEIHVELRSIDNCNSMIMCKQKFVCFLQDTYRSLNESKTYFLEGNTWTFKWRQEHIFTFSFIR
jgi:hypothetical protein